MSDFLADAYIHEIRQRLTDGLGVTVAFIDDHAQLAITLAQRAILAGLAVDADPETLARLTEASEKHRQAHENHLGFAIPKIEKP